MLEIRQHLSVDATLTKRLVKIQKSVTQLYEYYQVIQCI